MSSKVNKVADVVIILFAIIAIYMFINVLIGSIHEWSLNFPKDGDKDTKMFWIGILAAIIYAVGNWILDFINMFAKSFRSLFSKSKDERRANEKQ